jgi:hypothetical protein
MIIINTTQCVDSVQPNVVIAVLSSSVPLHHCPVEVDSPGAQDDDQGVKLSAVQAKASLQGLEEVTSPPGSQLIHPATSLLQSGEREQATETQSTVEGSLNRSTDNESAYRN